MPNSALRHLPWVRGPVAWPEKGHRRAVIAQDIPLLPHRSVTLSARSSIRRIPAVAACQRARSIACTKSRPQRRQRRWKMILPSCVIWRGVSPSAQACVRRGCRLSIVGTLKTHRQGLTFGNLISVRRISRVESTPLTDTAYRRTVANVARIALFTRRTSTRPRPRPESPKQRQPESAGWRENHPARLFPRRIFRRW